MADITGMLQAAAGYAASQTGGYQIERSLRFNSADSAYLSRTPGAGTSDQIMTFSFWVKRSKLNAGSDFFYVYDGGAWQASAEAPISFSGNAGVINCLDIHKFNGATLDWILVTNQVFRDVSGWYHIVVAFDTTQATASNRIKVYVNGVQVTSFNTATYPTQNSDTKFNATSIAKAIGRWDNGTARYYDGYLTEFYFVDGQQLTPSDFGETDATTGVWKPKAYAGEYGTNGFYLNFSDNTSTTTIGYDTSGNGNNWTANNFSVAAGAGNDSLVDTPTPYGTDTGAGGEVRGNYCTLDPISSGLGVLSNGNLQFVSTSDTGNGTISVSSGKWYWEVTIGASPSNAYVGIIGSNFLNPLRGTSWADHGGIAYKQDGNQFSLTAGGSSVTAAYGASYTANDVIGIALDMDANTLTFYKNNSSQGTTTNGPSYIGVSTVTPMVYASSATFTLNFGQRPFAYTAPSGFKALCTQNLAEGTITTSGTFTGNGSTDGPFVYLNGVPTAMTIDGNAVTFGTHADKLANGFKVRSSSASYNANATSMSYTISTTGAKFKYANAQPNP